MISLKDYVGLVISQLVGISRNSAVINDKIDDNNFQNSLCITSMKQKLSGPIEAHGPFIYLLINLFYITYLPTH